MSLLVESTLFLNLRRVLKDDLLSHYPLGLTGGFMVQKMSMYCRVESTYIRQQTLIKKALDVKFGLSSYA